MDSSNTYERRPTWLGYTTTIRCLSGYAVNATSVNSIYHRYGAGTWATLLWLFNPQGETRCGWLLGLAHDGF